MSRKHKRPAARCYAGEQHMNEWDSAYHTANFPDDEKCYLCRSLIRHSLAEHNEVLAGGVHAKHKSRQYVSGHSPHIDLNRKRSPQT
jgi:hypothetical protein